ncbi:MAG TPA: site-specific tyrosine recombinase/integron integrase [Candidatus Paceibacterota bacterium]|jgi:site-specific recombinase XerD
MTDLLTLKREFLEHLEIEKGRSLKTIESYDRYLTRFLDQTEARDPKEITDDLVREFRLWLNRQTGAPRHGGSPDTLKKKTQNYYLIALRAFLKYLRKRDIVSLQPERIELAKVSQRDLDLISSAELERLMQSPKGTDVKCLRDRAMLELLFSTGLRVSELCALNSDLDFTKDELSVRGKGDKVRVVFLSPAAKEALKTYLAARTDMDEALFVQLGKNASENGSFRLTPRSVERLVKRYAIKAGITRKVTPHIIRHSFATDLLSNGADLRSVQALLGHANIATTQVYTHVTDKHLREIHRAFHGKNRR